MGIKSNSVLASYFNRFGATGKGASVGGAGVGYIEATGGIVSDYEDSGTYYRAHVFISSGALNVTDLGGGPGSVDYLIIGGGGG